MVVAQSSSGGSSGGAPVSTASELLELLKDPVFLEVTVLGVVAVLVLWILLSMRSSLRRLQGRKLLYQYLEGVEAALSGDPEAASEALTAVVGADPENVGARLALGDALYKLRRPTEAHQQHVEAREVFDVGGAAVQLSVVRDLRAAGETAEALQRVDEALAEHPRNEPLLEEAWEIKTEAGLFPQAVAAGRLLFESRGGAELRKRLAVTAARAGMLSLSRGDRERAEEFFRESLGYDSSNREARTGRLLLAPEPDLDLLPAPDEPGTHPIVSAGDGGAAAILDFFPESICPACSSPRTAGTDGPCAVCGSEEPPVWAHEEMRAPVSDPDGSLDEIEENEAWFRRLAVRLDDGDSEALALLEDGGAAALAPLLAVMLERGDVESRLREAAVRLGRRFPGALLAARDELKGDGRGVLGRLAGRVDVDVMLGPVFRRLGREALPTFQELIVDGTRLGDRGLRGLVVDYFIGLADLVPFEDLAARYSPVEIVRKLNKVPADELAPLVGQLPDGPSFLREAILLDPAFDQPEAIVLALVRAEDALQPRFLELLDGRGPGPQILAALVRRLGEGETGRRAEAALSYFGAEALQHLVAGFADPEIPGEALEALCRLLQDIEAEAVPEIVRCFGSTPSDVDDRALVLLSSMGDRAVPHLERAYRQQVGWLGKLGAKLLRGRHPRASIARVLARMATDDARAVLRRLLADEKDAELTSLLRELLRARGQGGGT